MAADVKKTKIAVEKMLNPFAETKTKKVPTWTSLRPNVLKNVAPVFVKRTMELDGRKWKKKDIEDGVYAVARYELQLFATHCSGFEKAIMKTVAAHKPFKNKLPKTKKDETPDLTKELDRCEKEIIKVYKAISKKIEDKVSLALDEVESDKGDNKKALATGREALKRFDGLNTSKMFSGPTLTVATALGKLSSDLSKAGTDKEGDTAFKSALGSLRKAESDFESTGKTTRNVVRFLMDTGDKMAKNKNAAPELQAFGKKLSTGPLKKKLTTLVDVISDFAFDLDDAVNFAAAGSADAADVLKLAKGFAKNHKGDDRAVADSVKEVQKLSKEFKGLLKDLK